jgi:tetratricopeptide (TPR) repeat protein
VCADVSVPQGRSEGVEPGAISSLLRDLAAAPEIEPWRQAPCPGAIVGRYEIGREIGRGGFGVVYEARDRVSGSVVAFKTVRASANGAPREERLLLEAETAARLAHPNIVRFCDAGRCEHGPYLVLELLRGQTLQARLQRGLIPLHEALRIAQGATSGVAHAHAEGVVHRDLKPGNVFLCEDGRVKVLDFGLAHAFGRRCADGGTPAYMAPEQRRGAPEDERTDVFALGVILFAMLAGKLPFPEHDGGKALTSSRPAPDLEVPGAPGLGQLVGRMLAKDPVARPRDAGEVLAALTRIRAARDGPEAPPLAPVRTHERRRWLVALALGGAGSLAITALALVAVRLGEPGSAALEASRAPVAAYYAPSAVTRSPEAERHYVRGLELRMRDCDYVSAAREQRRALALDPQLGAAHLQLAAILLHTGEPPEDANAHFRAARELAPGMPDKERRLIEHESSLPPNVPLAEEPRDADRTLRALDDLVERYPSDAYVLWYASWANAVAGRRDRVLDLALRSVEAVPGQCYAGSWAMGELFRRGRDEEALALARRTFTARGNGANAALLASVLAATGRFDEAASRAREALAGAPTHEFSRIETAACALATAGFPGEALEHVRRLWHEGATSGIRRTGQQLVAIMLGLQGRPREAARAWPDGDPQVPEGLYPAGHVDPRASLLATGRTGNSAPESLVRLRSAPNVLLLPGELALLGDLDAGARAAEAVERGSPTDLHYRAVHLAIEGPLADAIPALRSLLLPPFERVTFGAPDPRPDYQLDVRLLLGEALLQTGRPDEALEVLASADAFGLCDVEAVAHYPRIQVARARALERLDRPSDALRQLDRLLLLWAEADPDLPLLAVANEMRAHLEGGRARTRR